MDKPDSVPILIFDGVCNLCNSFVDFVLRHEREPRIQFTANQEEAGKRILTEHGISPDDVSTVYFYENGQLYTRSEAALRVARYLKAPYRWATIGRIFPRGFRNLIYDFVAKNRYRWFGKRDSCRLPTPKEAARFV